jgi:DNA-binding transcriptional MerR regulator
LQQQQPRPQQRKHFLHRYPILYIRQLLQLLPQQPQQRKHFLHRYPIHRYPIHRYPIHYIRQLLQLQQQQPQPQQQMRFLEHLHQIQHWLQRMHLH